jgi:hypothetical protein
MEIAKTIKKNAGSKDLGPSPNVWMDLDYPRASKALD